MSSYKTGRWSNTEIDLVKTLVAEGKNYEQISERVNRPPETIQKMVEDKLLMNISEEAQITRRAENDIKSSAEWRQLEKQLNPDEQDIFLNHWRELVAQFNNNVTHTEKLQMMDLIRNEILMGRVLERINTANMNIAQAQEDYQKERSLDLSIQDPLKLVDLQRKIAETQIAIGSFNKEYESLSLRKNATLKDIKGTREQRVKRLEESKETITGWVASLISEPDLREKLGKWTEKFRIAQTVEYQRLSEYHKYDDGQVEQPILNYQTLQEDNR